MCACAFCPVYLFICGSDVSVCIFLHECVFMCVSPEFVAHYTSLPHEALWTPSCKLCAPALCQMFVCMSDVSPEQFIVTVLRHDTAADKNR